MTKHRIFGAPSRRQLSSLTAFSAMLGVTASVATGCVEDPDCGICDPENLVLEMMAGVNYQNEKVFLVSPDCEGGSCPSPFDSGEYFIEDLSRCTETEEAAEDPRGAEEHCKLSPLVSFSGIEFIFNNLLEPTTVELVRKNPSNPQLFETYDWKSRILEIQGPTTRYNGDYVRGQGESPDVVTRSVNLTCIENLDSNTPFHELFEANPAVCDAVEQVDGQLRPLRMQIDGTLKAYRGTTTWWGGECDTPQEGPDTCCSVCDYAQSVGVAKYGVTNGGDRRTPANAISCDPDANLFQQCADFLPEVERFEEENSYSYDWNNDGQVDDDETFPIPRYDKLRETHPDDRPPFEQRNVPCSADNECGDAGLDGYQCVGTDDQGNACTAGSANCSDTRCQAEWFVDCVEDENQAADPENPPAFCVDKRWKASGAGACYVTNASFTSTDPETGEVTSIGSGRRLSLCDGNENNFLTAEECCQDSLGGGAACDPVFQPNVRPINRFDRDTTLPEETRDCYCGDPANQRPECAEQIEKMCTAPWGNLEKADGTSNEGNYVTRFVRRTGGVIYDPAVKGVLYLPGDLGQEERARVERCAEQGGQIEGRTTADGWRAGDSGRRLENLENFDRGMCSGSEYRVVFATDGEVLEDKVGNTMAGKETYVFQTPQFHVVPGSGFPTDNLRIGACDEFTFDFSNKYDMSPENLRKLEIWSLNSTDCSDTLDPSCWELDQLVAGGADCKASAEEIADEGGVPCLTSNAVEQWRGTVTVGIDTVEFGKILENERRYRIVAPGLRNYSSLEDLAADHSPGSDTFNEIYQEAFHDICGMPLITAGSDVEDFNYDFTIDEPKCKEDEDRDDVQISCDNAKDYFNPGQENADGDRFGDVWDLCPTIPSEINTADADKDGIGNECDLCDKQAKDYNENAEMLFIEPYLWVRNVPFQSDFDQDGIGDACDNCIVTANCDGFSESNPFTIGEFIDKENDQVCQTDDNGDMVGDVCEGDQGANAAGPIGFTNDDDFDQDGIPNAVDYCPREPVVQVACTTDAECGEGGSCYTDGGFCNHRDSDGDTVGNTCDTCPYNANPGQLTAPDEDDPDGDFVGLVCETAPACENRRDPRPFAFYPVSSGGFCCTVTYPGDGQYVMNDDGTWGCEGLCDADGLPIQLDCNNEPEPGSDVVPDGSLCRKVRDSVADLPGVVNLPPGCDEALMDAGISAAENTPYELEDFDGDSGALYENLCFLPQWDQDFDGVGDECDLCPFSYDPNNEPYVDPNGRVFPTAGKYCNGEYDIDNLCADEDPGAGDTGTDTGGDTGGTDG